MLLRLLKQAHGLPLDRFNCGSTADTISPVVSRPYVSPFTLLIPNMNLTGFTSPGAIPYEFQKCNEDKEFAIYFKRLYTVGCLSIPVPSQLHSEKKLHFKLFLVPDNVI